ncbi:hypothetical protein N7499_001566 [Penicillium canescens]|nr:hypothetical protein N7499_001566 [Penicillium canescens]KAJ6165182.1 hypothetical protein N7485_008426 [Penicillium canescens]
MNPDPSEPSEDGILGVAVIAEFKPVGASCVDIQSATPASTHPDVYFKDRPGSSLSGDNTFSTPQRELSFKRVFPKNWNTNSIASATTGSAHMAPDASQLVSIMCIPSSPPSSISSKQNVRPTTLYTASTVVGHLEVPPRADTARDRQRSKPLAGGSGQNESTSHSKLRSAAPTVEERQNTRSSSRSSHSKGKHPQAAKIFDVSKGIPRTETPSTNSPLDKRLGTPSLSRSSHVKGKRFGRTTTMTDISTQTERNPRSSTPIAVPTMANLMKRLPPSHFSHWNDKHDQDTTALASVSAHAEKTSRSKPRFPMSKHPEVPHLSHVSHLNRKRDHATSTNSINDQNLENLVPLPLNIHKTGHDPLSYRARMESRESSSSSNTEDEKPVRTEWPIECHPAPYSLGDHFSEHEDAPWLLPVDSDDSEEYIESSPYSEPQPCLISLWGYSEAQKAAHRSPTSDDPRDMYHPGYSSYSHYSQIQYGSSSTDWQSKPANIVPNSSVYPLHTKNPNRNRREVNAQFIPRDVLDKMRNGALPDRTPQMPVLPMKITRKPVHSPTSSGSATRNSPQQQTSRPVSYREDCREHQTRPQTLQRYPLEGSYTIRQAEGNFARRELNQGTVARYARCLSSQLADNKTPEPQEALRQLIATAAL